MAAVQLMCARIGLVSGRGLASVLRRYYSRGDYAGLNAIKMLFWSAVLNGVLARPLIVIILIVCNNKRVMSQHVNGKLLNALGVFAALVMTIAAVAIAFISVTFTSAGPLWTQQHPIYPRKISK